MKKFLKKLFHWKWQLTCVLFAISFAVIIFKYVLMKQQVNGPNSQEILQKLSQLMVLPKDKPQIQTLTDVQLTKETWPDFYKVAQAGDLVIQYPNATLLYNPAKNKIINFTANGVFNRPKPAQVLTMALRYDGNEQYRALFLKRQIEEDMGNSAYQITEVSQSKATYKDDVIYVVNPNKKDLVAQFAKAIGNSPIVNTPDPNEAPTTADIIVAFKSMQ